ncbi:MAG: hypothetical protein WCD76_08890, partial [Pyrinomonadaceae bacterium]
MLLVPRKKQPPLNIPPTSPVEPADAKVVSDFLSTAQGQPPTPPTGSPAAPSSSANVQTAPPRQGFK